MTDYTKLVQALRCKRDDCEGCDLAFFDKDEGWMCQYAAKDDDAADAIEELKDMPWVESVQVDKLRQRIDELEETACHCNVRENAELIAKILDDDVDGKVYQMPKRGEIVRCKECIHFTQGGWCDREFDWFPVDENDFCSMAEKMEVQDGQ